MNNTQQRPCYGNMLFRRILAEVFQRRNTVRGFLYLIKKNECLPSNNCLTCMSFNITHNAARLQVMNEQVLGKIAISAIDINDIFIFVAPKLH